MAVSIVGLLMLATIGMFVIGFIVLVIAMITRGAGQSSGAGKAVFGAAVVGLVLLVLVTVAWMFFSVTGVQRSAEQTARMEQARAMDETAAAVHRLQHENDLPHTHDGIAPSHSGIDEMNLYLHQAVVENHSQASVLQAQVQPDVVVEAPPSYVDPGGVVQPGDPIEVEEDRMDDVTPPASAGVTNQTELVSQGVTVAGDPWTNAVEEFQDFEADVYPSLEAAAEALGRRVGARLVAMSEVSDTQPKSIYVWRDSHEGVVYGHTIQDRDLLVSREILEAVTSGIRQKIHNPAYVSVEQAPLQNRAENTRVVVVPQDFAFDNHNRWRTQAESRTGALALRVETAEESFSVSARFADAPWVENRTGFAHSYPNGDWLVGYSGGTHTSHDEARHDAILAASDAILPLAQARINRLSASDQHRFAQQMQKNPNWLRDKVADELVSRNLATDRFAQRFDRPYGTVWREAVLVNASPHRVEEIARSLVQGLDKQVTHQRLTWFSYFAMFGVVFGTYLFLNMATKGYYAWPLRTAMALGIAVVVIFIMRFA